MSTSNLPKRFLFVADVHANYEALRKLMKLRDARRDDTLIVFIGDLIDGYNLEDDATINTLKFVRHLVFTKKAILIRGNHDDQFLKFAKGQPNHWLEIGGYNTLRNLGVNVVKEPQLVAGYVNSRFASFLHLFERAPLQKAWRLPSGKTLRAVHAGFELDKPLAKQEDETLMWIREPYLPEKDTPLLTPKTIHKTFRHNIIVSGHTPNQVWTESNRIHKDEQLDLTRYFIDGGSNGHPQNRFQINLLCLDNQGNECWRNAIK